ncbi:MAG TPA: HAMP domain-containing sensor histidine kinase, partial [Nocardioides sp.]
GETLDHLLDRVASAIRSEQRLTSELAHELRTPLTAIQGSADLALLRGVHDEALREDLRQISASARDMAGVITTLLDAARDSTATGRTCRVEDVVPGLVALVADRVEVVDRTGGSSARIAAPADLVVRAVAPVVDNAARHARHRVVLEAVDHPDRVELVVSDDGEGVDASVREHLFEPGVSSRSRGAGLGLGISRRLARSFGGEVGLDPPVGAGTTFRVRLPRR